MKMLILAATMLLSSVSFASAVEIKASEYTCNQISGIIQREGNVFVRMTWWAGRSFRYPPYRCNIGDKYAKVSFSARAGESCTLNYACVRDPNHPINKD